ncbi:MAG: hypothetical protein AAF657_11320, partial [Acidobacteriota bacterium]
MDDEILVCVLHRGADLAEELDALANAQALAITVLVDASALDALHDEVGSAVFGRAAVEQLGDVGMVELGEDLALATEAAPKALGGRRGAEELDRNVLLERLLASSEVHG